VKRHDGFREGGGRYETPYRFLHKEKKKNALFLLSEREEGGKLGESWLRGREGKGEKSRFL